MSALEDLVERVAALRVDDLPAAVRDSAARVLLDDLGSILGGAGEPEHAALVRRVRATEGDGHATILAAPFASAPAAVAALVNAVAGVSLETDGGYRRAACHASSYSTPPALALGEHLDLDAGTLLLSLVAGYEVAATVAGATVFDTPVMAHSAWSRLAATAAAGKALGLSPARLLWAVAAALDAATPGTYTGRFAGVTGRNTYNGLGAYAGVLTAVAAASGPSSSPSRRWPAALARIGGFVRPEVLATPPYPGLRIEQHYYKRWPCCGFVHATLDAVEAVLDREPDLRPDDVLRVDVETFPEGALLHDRAPRTPLAARHSIPWAVAALLSHRGLGIEDFRAPALCDRRVRDLARRVEVRVGSSIPEGFSDQRAARVRIARRDGRAVEGECRNVSWDFQAPPSDDALLYKFLTLAGGALRPAEARVAGRAVLDLEPASSVRTLLGTLSSAARHDIAPQPPPPALTWPARLPRPVSHTRWVCEAAAALAGDPPRSRTTAEGAGGGGDGAAPAPAEAVVGRTAAAVPPFAMSATAQDAQANAIALVPEAVWVRRLLDAAAVLPGDGDWSPYLDLLARTHAAACLAGLASDQVVAALDLAASSAPVYGYDDGGPPLPAGSEQALRSAWVVGFVADGFTALPDGLRRTVEQVLSGHWHPERSVGTTEREGGHAYPRVADRQGGW